MREPMEFYVEDEERLHTHRHIDRSHSSSGGLKFEFGPLAAGRLIAQLHKVSRCSLQVRNIYQMPSSMRVSWSVRKGKISIQLLPEAFISGRNALMTGYCWWSSNELRPFFLCAIASDRSNSSRALS